MTATERALRIQIQLYQNAIDELSNQMAETCDKHQSFYKQVGENEAVLKKRIEDLSISNVQAVRSVEKIAAEKQEVIDKLGASTVDCRDLRKALDTSSLQNDRNMLIGSYLYSITHFSSVPLPIPEGKKYDELRIDLEENFKVLVMKIDDYYQDLSFDELKKLIG